MVAVGDVLNGRFELERVLGQGGFGRVFLASDRLLGRHVAIKAFNPELTSDPDFLPSFEAEARTVAALEHQHVLTLYDYGQDAASGAIFLVMPYVQGDTLAGVLRREGALPAARASRYLRQAAAAIDFAHRHHVVHRDIKPQNVLLRAEDDHLLLADFGIAKVLSTTSAARSTKVVGTLAYMAPEQIRGHVGPATDVYALGCVAFQLLAGAPPYLGPSEQVMYGHFMAPVPSLAERSGGRAPEAFQPVLERALAKEPGDRYPSATALAEAFAAAAGTSAGEPEAPGGAPAEWAADTVARTPIRPMPTATPTADDYAAAARAEAARRQADAVREILPPTAPAVGSAADAHVAGVEPETVAATDTAGTTPESVGDPALGVPRIAPAAPRPTTGDREPPVRRPAGLAGQGSGLRIALGIVGLAALLLLVVAVATHGQAGSAGNSTSAASAAAASRPLAPATPSVVPPTAVPPTVAPPTAVPPTAAPPTPVPPTPVPPTPAPPTPLPPTAAPLIAAPAAMVVRLVDNLGDTNGLLAQEAEDVTVWMGLENKNVGTISISKGTPNASIVVSVRGPGRYAYTLSGQGFGVITALAAMKLNNAAAAGMRVPYQIRGDGELVITRSDQAFALAYRDFSTSAQGALVFVSSLEPQ